MRRNPWTIAAGVLALALLVAADLLAGSRAAGHHDVEVEVASVSGRGVLGLAWTPSTSPNLGPSDISEDSFKEGIWDRGPLPIVEVRFGIERYGRIWPWVRYSQDRRLALRIDFADGSRDFVNVDVPDFHRSPSSKRLMVLVP